MKESKSPAILTWIVLYTGGERPAVVIATVPNKKVETVKTFQKIQGKNDVLLNITSKCSTSTKTHVILQLFLAPNTPISNRVTIFPLGKLALSGI